MPKILIVEGHSIVRIGLAKILADGFGGEGVSEASTAGEALEKVSREHWDIILLDISLPGRSGLDLLKDLKQHWPKVPVLVLSMHAEGQFAIRALRNGAAGYLDKDIAPEELLAALHKCLSGGTYIRASLAEKLAAHLRDTGQAPHEMLSDREFQVLGLIGSGKTASEIARELSLSIKTISTYRTRILEKMHMCNNAELMRYSIENRVCSTEVVSET